ncbi:MAG: 23S rRNA (guanosine(2251)-2'-O)-methyltransferase RlmB [Pseudomonadota bacterium]|nr:23S rRNA (guanosine(2251)-2'-O)-methyltransferase RlmB [Pseudomonadota bacterium]
MARLDTLIGFHAVTSRIRHHAASVNEIYVDRGRQDARLRDLTALAAERGVKVVPVEAERLAGMAGGGRHQGVVARVEPLPQLHDPVDLVDQVGSDLLLLVLDGVQDPHNLGACLRVADAMGVHAVVAPRDRAVALTATVQKVASGAADTVPYITVTNLARTLRELQDAGVRVIGTDDQGTVPLAEVDVSGPLAIVLGAEGAGLRRLTRETCDALVSIPMLGSVDSLNVSVAAGICLYEVRRRRPAAEP